jgi:hypothetical protein
MSSSSSNSSSSIAPFRPALPSFPFGSFLETLEAGPVEPFEVLVFFETALAFADFDAGVALADFTEPFAAGFTAFAVALVFADGLAAALVGLEVFETDLEVFTAATAFLVLGSLFEPAGRASFFGAAEAFATWSSRRKAFPGITKTHVKSDKSV